VNSKRTVCVTLQNTVESSVIHSKWSSVFKVACTKFWPRLLRVVHGHVQQGPKLLQQEAQLSQRDSATAMHNKLAIWSCNSPTEQLLYNYRLAEVLTPSAKKASQMRTWPMKIAVA